MRRGWQKIKAYWKSLPIERRGSIVIAIPLVCLIGAVITATLLRQRLIEAQMYVDRTNQVLARSQGSLISLLNAETGVRGYYIGRQKAFLVPYDEALNTLEPTLISLERLVQDNPAQVQRVKQLKQLAWERMNLLHATIQRVETNVISSPEVVVQRLTTGKQAMDKFRDLIEQIETEENRLLTDRTQSLHMQQDLNGHAMWFGVLISLLGTALTIRLLRQLAVELREREVRLRESRNLTEAIVANIVDAVMLVNAKGQIETFNAAAVSMFGYAPAEVIGLPWQNFLPQAVLPDQQVGVADQAALTIGKIWQAIGQRRNGEWFPIEASINQIVLDDDRIIIIRDISDRQQTAAKLAATAVELAHLNTSLSATNQSLRHSNRELDQFAYVTSHDLKAPLRAIASLAEWIEEDFIGPISPEVRSHLDLLRRRVNRMQALLDSLLEYSRAGRKQTPITMVNVGNLLTEVIQSLEPPETFTIDITSPMPTMNTRQQPLQQVFSHLIDNAIRHHPTQTGIIKIAAVDQGDYYEFSVADDGDGIDIQFQEKIYMIFQTLKARDHQENIGAGLAIIQKIATAEGGTIRLESASGSGATFRFTWPKQAIIKNNISSLIES
jgi:PAS domain S-box-containing protein